MLRFKPGLKMELASIIGVSEPSTARLIDGMEGRALVARGGAEIRVRILALTKARHVQVTELSRFPLAALDDSLRALQPTERRLLLRLCSILAIAPAYRAIARKTCWLCEHDVVQKSVRSVAAQLSLGRRENNDHFL